MQQFLIFVVFMSLLLMGMYAIEKDFKDDRLKCTSMGGSFIKLSGEFHCVSKDVFLNLR